MPKTALNEEQYLAELNRLLSQHEHYKVGMAFIPCPEGTSGRGMSGYSVTGPFSLNGVYAQVAHQVDQMFYLDI